MTLIEEYTENKDRFIKHARVSIYENNLQRYSGPIELLSKGTSGNKEFKNIKYYLDDNMNVKALDVFY